jgi:Putative lumazine-binding
MQSVWRKPDATEPTMTEETAQRALLSAVDRYLDMMYDGELERFDSVFAPTAQLHGVNEGQVRVLSAADYRGLLGSRPSPKSNNAPRQQEVLLIDMASPSQALVKVRVRIDDVLFVDYLSYHLIAGAWLVTAKSFHIEHRFQAASI